MRLPHRGETLIALRARRQAYSIARGVVDPHVELTSIPCRQCGGDVPFSAAEPLPRLPDQGRWWMHSFKLPLRPPRRCPTCGAEVPAPPSVVVDVEPPPEPIVYHEPIRPLSVWEWVGIFVILAVLFLMVRAVVVSPTGG